MPEHGGDSTPLIQESLAQTAAFCGKLQKKNEPLQMDKLDHPEQVEDCEVAIVTHLASQKEETSARCAPI